MTPQPDAARAGIAGFLDALDTASHWLHHHEQVKTVEVFGDAWRPIS